MSTATPTIYQSSDLNQRGRAVLDAAREGFARVRDKDGTSLVMTREERFEELQRANTVGNELAHAMASFMLIEQAVEHRAEARPALADMGDWVWVRYLPAEDLHDFVTEMHDALYQSCREFSLEPLHDALDAWRETAMALRDPLSRETLLHDSHGDDYVEVARPEGETSGTIAA
jgi:Family of unknown function (DUF6247)